MVTRVDTGQQLHHLPTNPRTSSSASSTWPARSISAPLDKQRSRLAHIDPSVESRDMTEAYDSIPAHDYAGMNEQAVAAKPDHGAITSIARHFWHCPASRKKAAGCLGRLGRRDRLRVA
jgi:hypothetical protein